MKLQLVLNKRKIVIKHHQYYYFNVQEVLLITGSVNMQLITE